MNDEEMKTYEIRNPEYPDWECHLFGSDGTNGVTYTPVVGQVPNWFQRQMSNIFFACKWVKK